MQRDVTADNVLQRRRDEEEFLSQTQFLACRGLVARIKHARNRLGMIALGEGADMIAAIEAIKMNRIARACRPETQRIGMAAAPTDHRSVIRDRLQRLGRMPDATRDIAVAADIFDKAPETYSVGNFRPLELPRIAERQPVLRHFVLPAVDHPLPEQPEFVTDAVAVGWNLQRRHAVHEAGGEPAEAAI